MFVLIFSEKSIINEHSEDADLTIIGFRRELVKHNGTLIFQQLFNGKIIIMIIPPFIEGLGQPKPPYNLEILRPEELKAPFLFRHIEKLLKEVTEWEDFDDDLPEKKVIGFQTGFKNNTVIREGIAGNSN